MSPMIVKPMARLSQASPSLGGKIMVIGSNTRPPSSPPSKPPSKPFSITFGSRKAIPWPIPAGIAATAQPAARPIMKIKSATPLGISCCFGCQPVNMAATSTMSIMMIEPRINARNPPAKPIPKPTLAQIRARCALRHMIPSAAPRNIPMKPATVGKSRRFPHRKSSPPIALSSKKGSTSIQATNAPSPLAKLR